ncbi:Plasma kallikrein [Armadillidium vulgare]|nr:Plasma kallikrein [Armadillidium vulgare]
MKTKIYLEECKEIYTHEIVPICLPPLDQSFEDEEVIVCGWGALREKGGPSKVLRKTTVKILSNSECGRKLRHFYKNDFMICAALPGSDACQGDSGGPLMLRLNMYQYAQVGVVSFGIGCGNQENPGVYSRLTKYFDWIKNHTSDATYCENPTI